MASLSEQLLKFEMKLLDPALRRTPEMLAPMLADNFVEFGSSGRTYDKKQVLYQLSRQLPAQLTIEEFRVVELAPDAALVPIGRGLNRRIGKLRSTLCAARFGYSTQGSGSCCSTRERWWPKTGQ